MHSLFVDCGITFFFKPFSVFFLLVYSIDGNETFCCTLESSWRRVLQYEFTKEELGVLGGKQLRPPRRRGSVRHR